MKFLIIKLSSLGDIVHALPIVNCLRKKYPDSQIDWLVNKSGYELLSLVSEINNVYELNLNSLFQIQREKYDYVIDAQGLFKSAFLSRFSFGKTVVGFKNAREFADLFYDIKVDVGSLFKTNKHIVDLNLELIANLIQNDNSNIRFLIPEVIAGENIGIKKISSSKKKILIFPSTTWESKMWPLNYWFDVISNLVKHCTVFLCASKGDIKNIEQLINKLDSGNIVYENLVGKTQVKDLIYLIQNVDVVIGLDSFGLHLSSAIYNDYGHPEVVGIYGPTNPKRNGPYKLLKNCFYLSELECIACRKKKCPLGHHNCMNNIVPSYVLDMVFSKLSMVNSLSWLL